MAIFSRTKVFRYIPRGSIFGAVISRELGANMDPKIMFSEMLDQWSFVPSKWVEQLGHLKDRVERYKSIGKLTTREIDQINRAYQVFCYYRGPRFVQGGAPGLGKRSSRQFDPRGLKGVEENYDD